jgi:DMSO/TMAO reductase YedYZ molybdopterin-dependent catalytic subunit
MVTRGFTGRQSGSEPSDRIPPGQHLVDNFPVLTAGPTPRIDPADWTFTLKVGPRPVKAWSWSEFNALPQTRMTRDIHCVTSWSKFNTAWEGVAVDDILADAGLTAPTPFALAHCYDGYSTNVPLADLTTGKAMVALKYEGQPLPRPRGAGAPARAAPLLLEVGEMGERASVHGA